jgi:HKD family nuclease
VICRLFAQQQRGQQLGAELISLLKSGDYSDLTVVVAFLRSEGVDQLKNALEQFVGSGKKALFVVGISGRVTSYEGLKLLLETVKDGNVTIFYNANSSAGIFHPKLYFLQGEKKVAVVIASNNFTRPGLFVNDELALIIDLDPQAKEDSQLQADVTAYIADLIANGDVAKPLTSEFLEKLKEHGALQIETKEPKSDEQAEEDAAAKLERSARQNKIRGLFGSAPVTSAPPSGKKAQPKVPGTKRQAATPQPPVATGPRLIMRAYKSRGTQVQVPMATTFFAKGDRIISARSKAVRTINPAKSHGRPNTLKIEISESRDLDVPIIVFQRTASGVVYNVFDGKTGEGARLLKGLEQGLADGSTQQTRRDSTMYRVE